MPMQQMAMMAYKAPPGGGGGDSASLASPTSGGSNVSDVSLIFNPSNNIAYSNFGIGYYVIAETASGFPNAELLNHYWKTGPNAASDYEGKYIQTAVGTNGSVTGLAVNTWIVLDSSDTPTWTCVHGVGSFSSGYLVIRNKNTLEELSNVAVQLIADPNI